MLSRWYTFNCNFRAHVCVCVLHMLDSFFKQHQVHDSMQLIIMLQSISQGLLEFLPV